MKKLLSTLACTLTLLSSFSQANASLITEWDYKITSLTLAAHPNDVGNVDPDYPNYGSWEGASAYHSLYVQDGANSPYPGGPIDLLTFSGSEEGKEVGMGQASTQIGGVSSDPVGDNRLAHYGPLFELFIDVEFSTTGAEGYTSKEARFTFPIWVDYQEVFGEENIYYTLDSDLQVKSLYTDLDGASYSVASTLWFNYDPNQIGGENQLNIFANNGGYLGATFDLQGAMNTTPPAPTPEPATMLLMGAGLAGVGFMKRREKK